MFGLLKKKIGDFISGLTKKEEEKPVEEIAEEKNVQPEVEEKKGHVKPETVISKEKIEETTKNVEEKTVYTEKLELLEKAHVNEITESEKEFETQRLKKLNSFPKPPEERTLPKLRREVVSAEQLKQTHVKEEQFKKPVHPIQAKRPESEPVVNPLASGETVHPEPRTETLQTSPTPVTQIIQKPEQKPRDLKPKLGLLTQLKGFFTNAVTINENELEPLLDDLRMALLESDVTLDTSDFLIDDLKNRLTGKKVEKAKMQEEIRLQVRESLKSLFKEKFDLDSLIETNKPCVILFVGPNGAGKTTTIAKISSYLKQKGKTVVLAASDSFRSGAIHQLNEHATKIGVNIVKHDYGSDPTAVAFDAISMAKARGIDVVLIDTAGRQETNYNLVKEMEKMNRVLKPNAKIFVGEAVSGHALVEQAKKFHETIGLDAIVLTKMDCDAKGGTSFSIAHEAGLPFLYLGTGQDYSDLREFDADWIVDNVMAK